eukprot:scaffold496_cov236-Pinguiococcus_pyrenoidosus.AAC.2
MRTVALLAALVCLLRPASSFGVGVRVGASTTHVARTGTQRGTRQRAFVKGPGDDDVEDAPRWVPSWRRSYSQSACLRRKCQPRILNSRNGPQKNLEGGGDSRGH